jgi:hypothetical protein
VKACERTRQCWAAKRTKKVRPVPFLGPLSLGPGPTASTVSDFLQRTGSARLKWAPGHCQVPATLHPSAPQALQAAAFSEWRPVIGGRALRNVALSRFCAAWPYSRASGWCGRGESPVAALERAPGGRSGGQQVAVTCRDPGRDGTKQTKNSCSPRSGSVQQSARLQHALTLRSSRQRAE